MEDYLFLNLSRDSHFKIFKKNKIHNDEDELSENSHECSYSGCKKKYKKNSNLLVHMRTHTGEKPYQCCICLKSFNEKGNLKTHLRTHTGERPFNCDYAGCYLSFKTGGQLKEHYKIHTYTRPFKCLICKGSFARKSTLLNHMKSSSHRELIESSNSNEFHKFAVEQYNSQDLKIQSYSLSFEPDNHKNSLEFLLNTIPLDKELFVDSCEDLNSKNRHLLLGDLEDMTFTPKTSPDDYYFLNLGEDMDL